MTARRAFLSTLGRLASAAVLSTLASCMVQLAAKTDRSPDPALRGGGDVHVALYADDAPTEHVLRRTLEAIPYVRIDTVAADERERLRASCKLLSCDDQGLETWARDHGDTVLVVARTKVTRAGTRVCASFRFTSQGGECLDEYVEDETATVELSVVAKLARAAPLSRTRWRANPTLRGHGEGQGPHAVEDAHAAALTTLPTEGLAATFTPQVTIAEDGRLAEPVAPEHQVFAVFRDGKRVMTVETNGDAGTGTTTPLFCCHEPRPGDTLVYRGPQMLLEFLPTVALTRISLEGDARAAGLFGLDLRVRNLRRGLHGGVRYEYAVARDARLSLGTVELGYGFRPSPSLTLALLAGVGGGQASRNGDHANGGHVDALARATWEVRRWVFLNLDAGLIQSFGYRSWKDEGGAVAASPLHLAGPLVRLAIEVR